MLSALHRQWTLPVPPSASLSLPLHPFCRNCTQEYAHVLGRHHMTKITGWAKLCWTGVGGGGRQQHRTEHVSLFLLFSFFLLTRVLFSWIFPFLCKFLVLKMPVCRKGCYAPNLCGYACMYMCVKTNGNKGQYMYTYCFFFLFLLFSFLFFLCVQIFGLANACLPKRV